MALSYWPLAAAPRALKIRVSVWRSLTFLSSALPEPLVTAMEAANTADKGHRMHAPHKSETLDQGRANRPKVCLLNGPRATGSGVDFRDDRVARHPFRLVAKIDSRSLLM